MVLGRAVPFGSDAAEWAGYSVPLPLTRPVPRVGWVVAPSGQGRGHVWGLCLNRWGLMEADSVADGSGGGLWERGDGVGSEPGDFARFVSFV